MHILIVGGWQYPMYEKAVADALTKLGQKISLFSWKTYVSTYLGRFETKFCINAIETSRLNKRLIKLVKNIRPEIVLIWRGTNILPATLRNFKRYGVRHISSYNHDDFTGPAVGAPVPWHHRRLWRLFLKCAPLYDSHFVKRKSNIDHLYQIGAKRASIMPLWFVPEMHKPFRLTNEERSRFETDVVFVGHYEPDERVNHLRALVQSGLSVKLFGGPRYWTPKALGDLYSYFEPIFIVEGDNYAKALCGAKVCLAFLSKLNRDTYTRRCFEIPACGGVMLAERTDDLLSMFKEDYEACFFSSSEELVAKALWLMKNPDIANRIALAGQRRVWADGHDVNSRAAMLLSTFEALR